MSQRTAAALPQDLRSILRCPKTHERLQFGPGAVTNASGTQQYGVVDGIADLRLPPKRIQIDLPWCEPWDEIDGADFRPPAPVDAQDLPFHLDAHQAAIVEEAGRGGTVLEIGCGERAAERFFRARDYDYIGIDVDVRGPGPDVLCDAHNLPFQDASFDLYYAMAVYEHLVCPQMAACEAFRVLRPGGTVFGSAAFIFGFHDRASFFHMTHGGLVAILRAAGFENIRIWPGWGYTSSMPQCAFNSKIGLPWKLATKAAMKVSDYTYTRLLNLARRATGREPVDLQARRAHLAGGLNFAANKPARDDDVDDAPDPAEVPLRATGSDDA